MRTSETFFKQVVVLILTMAGFAFTGNAQSFVVEGLVTDGIGEPVIGASVVVKGKETTGTVTNIDGAFKLKVPGAGTVLKVTYVGMKPAEVKVGSQHKLKIVLQENSAALDEVVVVGYGQQKKASVVGSITQTTAKVLERAAGISDIGAALTGNLPGVVTVASTGQPGEEEPEITIRGAASWNGGTSSPLVLVDGIERPMSSVDISSVATISVLKDASATAVYGVKGANGVILITTKRGGEGKAKIEMGFNATIKAPSRLPGKYDAYDALMARNEACENELAISPDSWSYVKPMSFISNYRNQTSLEQMERYPNVDWQKALFKDNAMSYNTYINVSGGTKLVKYFVAFDYVNEGDLCKIYPNNRGYEGGYSYNRLNVRSNLDFQLTNTTLLKANLSGSNAIKKSPYANQGDMWQLAQRWAGAYNIAPDVFIPQYADGAWGYYPNATNVSNSAENISLAGLTETTTTRINTDFTLEQKLDFVTKGLVARATISWDNIFVERDRGVNDLNNGALRKWIDPETGQVLYNNEVDAMDGFDWAAGVNWSNVNGTVDNSATTRNLYYSAQLNWGRQFGKHDVSAMGLFSRQEGARGSVIPAVREDWVFRLTYNYAGRYFAEYNGAYNGSEKFAPGNRFAFFNSGALGWTVSEEPFMKYLRDKKIVDMLKIRASYGEIGSDALGDMYSMSNRFLYVDEWNLGGNTSMDLNHENSIYTWYRQAKIGNPDIQWEVVKKKNIGVDYAFLGGLVAGSIDFFRDDRSNIFVRNSVTTPSYFGGSFPTYNKGKTKTIGYELELRVNKAFRNGLHVWGNFNMTHARNEVVVQDDPELYPNYRKNAGYAIGQAHSHIDNGFINNYDQLIGAPERESDAAMLIGDHYIVDFNGDGIVDNVNDQAPVGYSNKPENTYSATVGFEWKGFSAFAQFYGVTNVTRWVGLTSFGGMLNTVYDNGAWWTPAAGWGDVVIPRWGTATKYNEGTQYMYDGSFIRLKNIELAYTFTQKWVKSIGVNSIKLYVNGNNLWLWTRMPDDREGNLGGFEGNMGAYPTVKRYNIGIKLSI